MFTFAAPYPTVHTTIILPSPRFSNGESLTSQVHSRRALDGTQRTYVRRSERRKVNYVFRLARMKALALRAFITSFYASELLWTDHCDQLWRGHLTVNPFELSTDGRYAPGGTSDGVRAEVCTIQLELQGFKL